MKVALVTLALFFAGLAAVDAQEKGAGIKTLRTILSLPFYMAAVFPLTVGLALLILADLVQGDNS